jgi:hypothetical protein
MNQQSLFDAVARHTDPATAKQAAEVVNTAKLESEVRYCLHEYGPQTTVEIADRCGRALVSISPRLRPMANKGLVADSGERRAVAGHREAIVWKALP